ncbi:MAG: exodeoxyribonuclease VII small subunit [Deltaproteobacteria bacterium]|nr:exodeoxyribonuclease VII small subunit [Deltaproteobacteria bacterium]
MTKTTKGEDQTFEDALSALDQHVRQLEKGDLSLDASLTIFEEGTRLVRLCESMLQAAKGRIDQLIADTDGNMRTEPFTDDTTTSGRAR